MRLTLPQIIMLNHASSVNWKRMESRNKNKKQVEDKDPVVMNGKRLSELNTDELDAYLSNDT